MNDPAERRYDVPLCQTLTRLLPATAAGQARQREQQLTRLNAELTRITTAEAGIYTELERLGADTRPATQAYRARLQERHDTLYTDRTAIQTQITDLQATTPPDNDPALLNQLPTLAGVLADAPDSLKQALLAAFDIQTLYNSDDHQVTIWATITDHTPRTINALLADPRTDSDTHATTPALDTISHSAPTPIAVFLTHVDGRCEPVTRDAGHGRR